jgi:2'-5' RNA ligase
VNAGPRRRLFFALWPDDPLRHALLHWQTRHLPGEARWTHRDDLHLTLHFLGDVDAALVDDLAGIGDQAPRERFALVLDRLGYWPRPRVLWAGPSETPAALLALHRALGAGLIARGLRIDRRRFVPHVTLARGAVQSPAELALGPVAWPVRELALVESRPGRVPAYRPLRRWWLA